MLYVIRTGFSTVRGQLIRSILYPKPYKFKFIQESVLYIIALFFMAIIGFCIIIPRIHDEVEPDFIVIKFLDLITITVPPSLQAAIQVGIGFSLFRLEKKKIFCTSPPKVRC